MHKNKYFPIHKINILQNSHSSNYLNTEQTIFIDENAD